MRRREDGERGTLKSTGANAWRAVVEVVMADRPISKRLNRKVIHEHLCDTGMPVRNGT